MARMICECGSFPIGFFLQPLILSTNCHMAMFSRPNKGCKEGVTLRPQYLSEHVRFIVLKGNTCDHLLSSILAFPPRLEQYFFGAIKNKAQVASDNALMQHMWLLSCTSPRGVPKTPWAQRGPGVTPRTCGAIGERAQVILVWVRALGVGNASHPQRLGGTRVKAISYV